MMIMLTIILSYYGGDGDDIRYIHYYLLGGLEHGFYFPCHIWEVILPIFPNSIIFQDAETAPPTRIS